MGLEGVELVMDVEDRFNVSISDAEAETLQTVGQLHEYLMRRIQLQNDCPCPSSAFFYPIRKLMVDEFGVERNSVRPATRLETLVEEESRHDFWKRLESSISTRLPRLKRSKWLQWHGDVFPEECSTVSHLVQTCVDLNRISKEFGPDDSEKVWEVVRNLVAEIAGIDGEKIKPETSFVFDLDF